MSAQLLLKEKWLVVILFPDCFCPYSPFSVEAYIEVVEDGGGAQLKTKGLRQMASRAAIWQLGPSMAPWRRNTYEDQ